jgi:mRNA-degrading endonuclease RelE of RelBE toxin-antitoxin system
VKSHRTKQFREMLQSLPKEVQRQARAAYRQFERDPYHPSLQFKRVSNRQPLYSARIGLDYRVLGLREEEDEITWGWIGSHAEYDKLLSRMR